MIFETKLTIATFVICTLFPLLLIGSLNFSIFQLIAENQYKKNLSKQKLCSNVNKILLSDISIKLIKNNIFYFENRITNLFVYLSFVILYWIIIITNLVLSKANAYQFNWFNFVSLPIQVILLVWFILRIFSKKINYFFINFEAKKNVKLEYVNISELIKDLTTLKIIDFNPISKKDNKQIQKIKQLINETSFLINTDNKGVLTVYVLLLYYYLSIYQNGNNKEIYDFTNNTIEKNIIINKKAIDILDELNSL